MALKLQLLSIKLLAKSSDKIILVLKLPCSPRLTMTESIRGVRMENTRSWSNQPLTNVLTIEQSLWTRCATGGTFTATMTINSNSKTS